LLNALTIDVEDYFHVTNFEGLIGRESWDLMPLRVEESTLKILEILSEHNAKATFFVLGWVAERFGRLVREIKDAGHEIASHGYGHRLAFEMTPDEFRADLRRSKNVIEDAIGERICGYRATSYSFLKSNLWCLKVLAEEGFTYDSSIFPVYHDRYGIPGWDRFPKALHQDGYTLYEVPPSTLRVLGYNLPMSGGGYLRLFPAWFMAGCIRSINRAEKMPAVVYLHPWEFDPEQPRMKTSRLRSFRHYNGLHGTERKVAHLLKNFRFGTISEAIDFNGLQAPSAGVLR
jgi:polysaccharide deacetylase family protein (PEP-CTERM system associated)